MKTDEVGMRPMWQDAAALAARAHRHQTRKDGATPYVAHAFRVAMTVRDVFGCEDQIVLAAALLHDTIEDTTTDYDDLLAAFGEDVARTVAATTKNMAMPEAQREEAYDAQLAGADWRARMVKLADTYDNLCDSRDRGKEKVEKMIAKCRRAIDLARADAAANPLMRRAVERLEALISRHAT
jgi:guanosine-3',5'-bis(diphosphate) 3'-pyrophosphohydrolase